MVQVESTIFIVLCFCSRNLGRKIYNYSKFMMANISEVIQVVCIHLATHSNSHCPTSLASHKKEKGAFRGGLAQIQISPSLSSAGDA